jgi:hypothetical protein
MLESMPSISDVVYAVTGKGFSALRNGDAPISLQVKTLLTLVDGVSPVAQYIPFLLAFAPLQEKFEALERLGLVRRCGTVSGFAVKMFQSQSHAGLPVSKLPRIDAQNDNSGFSPLF